MNLIRSLVHMLWMLVTVIPWGLALVCGSFFIKGADLWWFAVAWMRVVVWGARHILRIKVRVTGLDNLPRGQGEAAVLLSKHQSTLETLLIPTLMPNPLAFVFKRELLKIPFFGWSMARLDMIHINRESRSEAMKDVMHHGKRLLSNGSWVIMFPEGTRIARGGRGTYQTAGTRLAVEANVQVIPIAVSSGKCWPRKGFIKYPGIVDVTIGPAISSEGREPKDLMREVETWIEKEMRNIDSQAYN
tara:strand:- start:460 stop:1194 length:735 start_codon:yes stop_codon:yes gene_type:complete